MNIGIDIRPLMTPQRTGVGEYTCELLNALFAIDQQNQYFLFYNASTDVAPFIPNWEQDNVRILATRWPNKILNTSLAMVGEPRLDHILIKDLRLKIKDGADGSKNKNNLKSGIFNLKFLDWWFSPNLNFTALSPNTKHILTIHDLSFEFFPDCFSPKDRLWHKLVNPRRQCDRADIILTPSENTKRDVVEAYNVKPEKVRVLPPGLSEQFFKAQETGNWKLEIREQYALPAKYILYLGAIEPRKNVDTIVEAYKKSGLFGHDYFLIIAGPHGYKSEEVLSNMQATPGCQYIGYIAPEDKPALYRGASLFVYPSLYEGFGFPVLEAMASEVPVITSSRSSLPEVVGSAAYLVNPLNPSEIARAMEHILSDVSLHSFYLERGIERYRRFVWQQTATDFLALL